jgi:hypothetical protein
VGLVMGKKKVIFQMHPCPSAGPFSTPVSIRFYIDILSRQGSCCIKIPDAGGKAPQIPEPKQSCWLFGHNEPFNVNQLSSAHTPSSN